MTTQLRKAVRTMRRWVGIVPASTDYTLLKDPPSNGILDGWQRPSLPQRQWNAFNPILEDMRAGKYREDLSSRRSCPIDRPGQPAHRRSRLRQRLERRSPWENIVVSGSIYRE